MLARRMIMSLNGSSPRTNGGCLLTGCRAPPADPRGRSRRRACSARLLDGGFHAERRSDGRELLERAGEVAPAHSCRHRAPMPRARRVSGASQPGYRRPVLFLMSRDGTVDRSRSAPAGDDTCAAIRHRGLVARLPALCAARARVRCPKNIAGGRRPTRRYTASDQKSTVT